jgi:DNA-binding NtrC family response regulator
MNRSRSGKSPVAHLLDLAVFPIYIADSQRQIVYANPACCAWLGLETDERLIGARCDFHSDPNAQDAAGWCSGLCPPPEAFAGREARGIVTNHDGTDRRAARFVPLSDDAIACPGVIALVDPVPLAADHRPSPVATEAIQLHDRIRQIRRELKKPFQIEQLLGKSAAVQRIRQQVQLAAEGRPNVLICGPAGSGREHIARTIFYAGGSTDQRSLVPLSCELLDAELMQSTIDGLLCRSAELPTEVAYTLLLLEADRLPTDAQTVLTGFLAMPDLPLHMLSTVRTPLLTLAERREFRPDLAHCLSTLSIDIPSLADRKEDIPILSQAAVERMNAQKGRQLTGLTSDAIDRLAEYPWTRNTEELFEIVAQAHQRADGPYIQLRDLPEAVRLAREAATLRKPEPETIELDRVLTNIESELIRRALRQASGNKALAAKLLGIHRTRLLRRLEQLGLGDG